MHVSVFDEDVLTEDDFIGQVTVPFASLQPGWAASLLSSSPMALFVAGYSHIRLQSLNHTSIRGATLFVHVGIADNGAPQSVRRPVLKPW